MEKAKKQEKSLVSGEKEEKPKFISIATGGTGGTYYPIGGRFAKIIKDATGIDANAITSGASAENMAILDAAMRKLRLLKPTSRHMRRKES